METNKSSNVSGISKRKCFYLNYNFFEYMEESNNEISNSIKTERGKKYC